MDEREMEGLVPTGRTHSTYRTVQEHNNRLTSPSGTYHQVVVDDVITHECRKYLLERVLNACFVYSNNGFQVYIFYQSNVPFKTSIFDVVITIL